MKVKNPNFSLGRVRVRTVIIIENAITIKKMALVNLTSTDSINRFFKGVSCIFSLDLLPSLSSSFSFQYLSCPTDRWDLILLIISSEINTLHTLTPQKNLKGTLID